MFRRHRNCYCLIIYDPNDGTKGSNVHTREDVDVRDMEKVHAQILADKTERTRIKGVERYTGIAGNIVRRPRILGELKPDMLKEMLKEAGDDVRPLGKGRLKGTDFENGGGYRINFGGDGHIQYHPKKYSRHGGEYYKISTGTKGVIRYDIDGKRKKI